MEFDQGVLEQEGEFQINMRTEEQKRMHASYQRQWRANNPEKVREINRRYRENNKEKIAEWKKMHPESVNEHKRRWEINNAEKRGRGK